MAIQLCPANVHPRNILGSSSSFDRERLSPFGSLSSRCWEPVSLLHVREQVCLSSAQVGRFNGVPRLLWSTSPSAPGRPSLVANPARKGALSSIARTPPAVASRRYARTGGQRKTSGKLHVCARVSVASNADANNLSTQRRVLADCEQVFEDVGSGSPEFRV